MLTRANPLAAPTGTEPRSKKKKKILCRIQKNSFACSQTCLLHHRSALPRLASAASSNQFAIPSRAWRARELEPRVRNDHMTRFLIQSDAILFQSQPLYLHRPIPIVLTHRFPSRHYLKSVPPPRKGMTACGHDRAFPHAPIGICHVHIIYSKAHAPLPLAPHFIRALLLGPAAVPSHGVKLLESHHASTTVLDLIENPRCFVRT